MSIEELYKLVKNYYQKKASQFTMSPAIKEITFILYDSFLIKCNLGERYGEFGLGVMIQKDICIRELLGNKPSLNNDEKSIKESLQIVDDYCRLRLPDKFLKAYDEAYNSFL